MVKEYYNSICAGSEIRRNLIALRSALKDEREKRAFAYALAGDFEQLVELLGHEDPKIRKNAALILGEMESEDLLPVLFDAYEKEDTLFIQADFLQAMSALDYESYLPKLKRQLEALTSGEQERIAEEQKHRSEEIRMLRKMILRYETLPRHRFVGRDYSGTVILTTNRCQREATVRALPEGKKVLLRGGVKVSGIPLDQILPIRTWSELLFPVEGLEISGERPEELGRKLADRRLLDLIRSLHEGSAPYYYRIELKSRIPSEKKGVFIRRLSESFDQASGGALVNSATDYELELRLVQKADGSYVVMLKLFTLKDRRFAYRTETVASSIAPVNAALAVSLAKPWLKEQAQILDPFCGVGTMLIERNFAVQAGTMYGIDIYGEAIERARSNTDRLGMHINYINKDFFSFTHEYRFDEIITDLPQVTQAKPREAVRALYEQFFSYALRVLKEEAVMVLYATEPQFVRNEVKKYREYRILESWLINEQNHTTVFVIEVKQR